MNKNFFKGLIVGFLLFNIVNAETIHKMINVANLNMPIFIEGELKDFGDRGFIHNGTTYLPIKDVAESLDRKVYYDPDNHIAYIFSEGNGPLKYKKEKEFEESKEFKFKNISIDSSYSNILKEYGNPKKVLETRYDFKWYVYHNNYNNFIMFGIQNNKVVAIYTNAKNWTSKNGIMYGSSRYKIQSLYPEVEFLTKGLTQMELRNEEKTMHQIDDSYTTIFYDEHEENKLTSILIIKKEIEDTKDNFYPLITDYIEDDYEVLMYELINAERRLYGLKTLDYNDKIQKVARDFSSKMIEKDFFDHLSPDGDRVGDRFKKNNVKYRLVVENLAAGNLNSIYAHEALMNSKGHRENILKEGLEEVGIGVKLGGTYKIYYTINMRKF